MDAVDVVYNLRAMNNIPQAEADRLFAMQKVRVDDSQHRYPHAGGQLNIPLKSVDKKEEFMLDITRSRIVVAKGGLQNRARQTIILARLDFGGQPHRNPDGAEIASPHLHLYREGYGDKWAFPVNVDEFPNADDMWSALQDFMRYCNIVNPPVIQSVLI